LSARAQVDDTLFPPLPTDVVRPPRATVRRRGVARFPRQCSACKGAIVKGDAIVCVEPRVWVHDTPEDLEAAEWAALTHAAEGTGAVSPETECDDEEETEHETALAAALDFDVR